MKDNQGVSVPDRADAGFVLRRFVVSVLGWGESTVFAATRGKALADAWRCDAFSGCTFGEFLKIARCRLDWCQPKPAEITVLGKKAYGIGSNNQYVQFAYPGKDVVLNAHPLDVLPESFRPRAYRTAQAIEARQGQDPQGLDRNDESAVRQDAPEGGQHEAK